MPRTSQVPPSDNAGEVLVARQTHLSADPILQWDNSLSVSGEEWMEELDQLSKSLQDTIWQMMKEL